ncbi:MAG: type II toxin-antitoxin system VapC family toxin [Actinomycetota bacterium]|nr:type II toxin-antitoxin system VapC family toxin [Actinomycetota bacterium]
MLVVDTSALIVALADPRHPAATAMGEDGDLHAPHLLDVEVVHAVRRLTREGAMEASEGIHLLRSVAELPIERYPHAPMTERMWALRHNVTAYDAAFVALAEILATPLLTADAKLAAAPGHSAEIRLATSRT